jgi:hypothetical protein
MTIARRFNAGNQISQNRVPKGRLNSGACPCRNAVFSSCSLSAFNQTRHSKALSRYNPLFKTAMTIVTVTMLISVE